MGSRHGFFASTEQDLCRTRSKVGSGIGQLARNERAQTVANQQQVRCRFDSEKAQRISSSSPRAGVTPDLMRVSPADCSNAMS